ncbi:hypothetical protein QBC46DRAFT_349516 [Diplogelasinospora grovesii]|uniref:Uncharacterized protein n=1 Tax=Diplogelasinospora grovesii TaxID=303347 RepID=A0AAN6S9Q1_9PEZI|nr:hypothetical protein QBC46DRAFT_349516 [Diplogelasinospora grovesii]
MVTTRRAAQSHQGAARDSNAASKSKVKHLNDTGKPVRALAPNNDSERVTRSGNKRKAVEEAAIPSRRSKRARRQPSETVEASIGASSATADDIKQEDDANVNILALDVINTFTKPQSVGAQPKTNIAVVLKSCKSTGSKGKGDGLNDGFDASQYQAVSASDLEGSSQGLDTIIVAADSLPATQETQQTRDPDEPIQSVEDSDVAHKGDVREIPDSLEDAPGLPTQSTTKGTQLLVPSLMSGGRSQEDEGQASDQEMASAMSDLSDDELYMPPTPPTPDGQEYEEEPEFEDPRPSPPLTTFKFSEPVFMKAPSSNWPQHKATIPSSIMTKLRMSMGGSGWTELGPEWEKSFQALYAIHGNRPAPHTKLAKHCFVCLHKLRDIFRGAVRPTPPDNSFARQNEWLRENEDRIHSVILKVDKMICRICENQTDPRDQVVEDISYLLIPMLVLVLCAVFSLGCAGEDATDDVDAILRGRHNNTPLPEVGVFTDSTLQYVFRTSLWLIRLNRDVMTLYDENAERLNTNPAEKERMQDRQRFDNLVRRQLIPLLKDAFGQQDEQARLDAEEQARKKAEREARPHGPPWSKPEEYWLLGYLRKKNRKLNPEEHDELAEVLDRPTRQVMERIERFKQTTRTLALQRGKPIEKWAEDSEVDREEEWF